MKKVIAGAAAITLIPGLMLAPAAQAAPDAGSKVEQRAKKKKKKLPAVSAVIAPFTGGSWHNLTITTKAKKVQVKAPSDFTVKPKTKTVKVKKGTARFKVLISNDRKPPKVLVRVVVGKRVGKWVKPKPYSISTAAFNKYVLNGLVSNAKAGRWCGKKITPVAVTTGAVYNNAARTKNEDDIPNPNREWGYDNIWSVIDGNDVTPQEALRSIMCDFGTTAAPSAIGIYSWKAKRPYASTNYRLNFYR